MKLKTIKTNTLKLSFNLGIILKDFSIFQFSTSEQYINYGSFILDEAVTGLKADSVVFEQGKSFFALFKDSTLTSNLISNKLNQLKEGEAISVRKVDSEEKAESLPKHIIAQLLLNSIATPQHKLLAFNNLTGSLYCLHPSLFEKKKLKEKDCITKIPALKVRIDKNLCLQLEVKTFSNLILKRNLDLKKPVSSYPKYTISYAGFNLRRMLPSENLKAEEVFLLKQEKGKKSTIPFLSIASKEKFDASKMGLLYALNSNIQEKLSDYLSISFQEVQPSSVERYDRMNALEKEEAINKALATEKINVVDLINDEDSNEFIQELVKNFKLINEKVKVSVSRSVKKSAFNLLVIHNEDYYSKYSLPDPYKVKYSNSIVQHVTVEDFKHNAPAVVQNTLKEICLKRDIQQNKISLINWKSYAYKTSWKFGLKQNNVFHFLEISPEGNLRYEPFEPSLFSQSEFDTYCTIFEEEETKSSGRNIEGIIISDDNSINIIERTDQFTVPNYEEIGREFDLVDKEFTIPKEELVNLFKSYSEEVPHVMNSKYLQNLLDVKDEIFTRKSILEIISHKTIKKKFTHFFYKETGNLLHYYFKDEGKRYKLLDSNFDIQYLKSEDQKSSLYFVGTKGENIQSSFQHASVIRKVYSHQDSILFFDKLLPTMNVEFVKNGNLTAVPFPFKYLREYIAKNVKVY